MTYWENESMCTFSSGVKEWVHMKSDETYLGMLVSQSTHIGEHWVNTKGPEQRKGLRVGGRQ